MVNQRENRVSAHLLIREWPQPLLVLVTIVPLLLAVPPHVRGSFNHIGLQQNRDLYMFYSSEGIEVYYGKKTFSNSCVVDV